jgi:hypothetical protein
MAQPFPDFETVNEKTWDRIGLDDWSQLKWFVKLANTTDFETMTDGEHLVWKEEFSAMLSKPSSPITGGTLDTKRYPGSAGSKVSQTALQITPTFIPTKMRQIRDNIAPHLEKLADDQGTILGGFHFTYTVSFHRNADYDEETESPRYFVYRGEMGGSPHESLLLRMTKLLETYADKIRRCPHCKKIFLQLNKSAKYCGPKCYTVAGMRRIRAERKTQPIVTSKNKKQAPRASRKKESRQGKT